MLLESGAFVNIRDHSGDPLLLTAVRGGSQQLFKAILQKFADVNVQDQVKYNLFKKD